MNRKAEFRLYLYTLEGYKRDVINSYTVNAVNDLISLGKDVDTYQVICCTTDLFAKGYRIFVHETPAFVHEITLGQCEGTTREIRMGHNLPNLILSGEFEYDLVPSNDNRKDPDTAIWELYEKAYPNNNGLPDISHMQEREDTMQ